MREKEALLGTIVGGFGGALDGIRAQLIRRTPLGYTVELLATTGPFHKGDRLHLSGAEFHLERQSQHDRLAVLEHAPTGTMSKQP